MAEAKRAFTKLVIFISLMVGLFITIGIEWLSYNNNRAISRNNDELVNYYKVLDLQHSVITDFTSMDKEASYFFFTENERYCANFYYLQDSIKVTAELISKTIVNDTDRIDLQEFNHVIFEKLNFSDSLMRIYRQTREDSLRLSMYRGKGLLLTQEFIELGDKINSTTQVRINALRESSNKYAEKTNFWDIISTVFALIVIIVATVFLFRDVNNRNQQEEDLKKQKEKAEENAVLKEQFMANMSHEIRTPMNAIIGFTNLLEDYELDEKGKGYLQSIKNSGENLMIIINDILDFSKIEAGMLRIERIPFSVSSLMDSLAIMFQERAKQKGLVLNVNYESAIPEIVMGDPTRLTQIMVNLIGNAIKFTKQGNVSIEAKLNSETPDFVDILFLVRDSGIGIPEDKKHEIFQRFNQGNPETTRQYGGTGLGLSIVKHLLELQGGSITFKSSEGLGSEFKFIIKYQKASEEEKQESDLNPNYSIEETGNMPHPDQSAILLVEDNLMNQELAKAYLSRIGYHIEVADNGAIALEMLKKKKYNLVLMDIQMPVLDGYKTAQKIRGELKLDIPIIAMTAHVMPGEKEKCIGFGMNDYIPKPFRKEDLKSIISKYLKPNEQVADEKISNANVFETKKSGVIDLTYLYELSNGNNDFVKKMIDTFLEESKKELTLIENAITQTDFETIQHVSHKMKSSVSFVIKDEKMIKDLSEMEKSAEKKINMERIIEIFNNVQSIYIEAMNELKNFKT